MVGSSKWDGQPHAPYHHDRSRLLAENMDPHLAGLIRRIAGHLGNDNRVVEAIQPTPEMFRILVKLVDMQYKTPLITDTGSPEG